MFFLTQEFPVINVYTFQQKESAQFIPLTTTMDTSNKKVNCNCYSLERGVMMRGHDRVHRSRTNLVKNNSI